MHNLWTYLNTPGFHTFSGTIISMGGVAVALGAIWRYLFWPLLRAIRACYRVLMTWERLTPVVLDMANQFKTNGGSSLRDSMNRVEAGTREAAVKAHTAMEKAAEASAVAGESLCIVRQLACLPPNAHEICAGGSCVHLTLEKGSASAEILTTKTK